MGAYVARVLARALAARAPGQARILMLGLAFKENVPDLRNTKVVDVVRELAAIGHAVDVHDPVVDPQEARHEYGIVPVAPAAGYDAVVLAVAHAEFSDMASSRLAALCAPGAVVFDVKGAWRGRTMPPGVVYKTL